MVEGRLILEKEVQEILECIDDNQNFLLSGGAGSGKTYSLVSLIRQLIKENKRIKIACITYTNVAVKEIQARVGHKNLKVSTFHDFLWDNIKQFQKELKSALISLANDSEVRRIKVSELDVVPSDYFNDLEKGIQYREYLKLRGGIISHDELLIVANYLFEKYPKLCDLVKNQYKFIFIDEYQDTHPLVVKILLEHFKNSSESSNVIGFFGDAMQAIYDEGIGDLNQYKDDVSCNIVEVKKEANRRNPKTIIDLANKLRSDDIVQVPSGDKMAPNMIDEKVKEGNILFFHSKDGDIEKVKAVLSKSYSWDFSNALETKELNLTHNLIADKAGFRTLMDIYDKDFILEYKDRIRKYINKNLPTEDFSEKRFGEVIDLLIQDKDEKELRKVLPTEKMETFINANLSLLESARSYNYISFSKIYINNDQLLDDKKQDENSEGRKNSKRDALIKHLYKIQSTISLYQNKEYNEFISKTEYEVNSIQDKQVLKDNIVSLIGVKGKTIEDVIKEANETGLCLIGDDLGDFKINNEYVYNRVKNVPYLEFQKLFEYLEGKTPFSTKHKTKGAEFDNVLIVIDNGGWNNYNFEYLFAPDKYFALLNENKSKNKSKITSFPKILSRTQKIFYVCCTRAKENLAVFYHNPDDLIITEASELFGENNVIELKDDLVAQLMSLTPKEAKELIEEVRKKLK
jgi:DNA helicase-2/ATP-dependent DNA helicase PcrA